MYIIKLLFKDCSLQMNFVVLEYQFLQIEINHGSRIIDLCMDNW